MRNDFLFELQFLATIEGACIVNQHAAFAAQHHAELVSLDQVSQMFHQRIKKQRCDILASYIVHKYLSTRYLDG
jgi:hypothetical protein